ncbi:hypothetical protein A4A49_11390 [Nicotiana attenuata]|uniref:Uncharacterized protein n=1 Tax=Nicotiana attenuata TaxID=49451 RepID=A0A1J6IF71_NICAT|nr:hypothetical protein A4A49_11390 [Nicotiana attenuata]
MIAACAEICMGDMDHFPEVIIWNTVGDAWRSDSDTAVLARADSGKETKKRLEDHTFMHIIRLWGQRRNDRIF